MAYAWLACEAMTGLVIEDLPDLSISSIGVRLGDVWSGTATLPLSAAPPDWSRATAEWASYLVCIDEDTQAPIWGGVIVRTARSEGDTISMTVAGFEAYLKRRFVVGDRSYKGVSQTAIAADLIWRGGVMPEGMPAHDRQIASSAYPRDREYADGDKTWLACLDELTQIDDGIEYTIAWRYLRDPSRYIPVVVVADHIGLDARPPAAIFEAESFRFERDWSENRGANHIVVTGATNEKTAIASTPHIFRDPLRPRIEHRVDLGEVTSPAELNEHAARLAQIMGQGAVSWSDLQVDPQRAPRLGVDWDLGDTVMIAFTSPSMSPRDQWGRLEPMSVVTRAIGWEMQFGAGPQRPMPTLADDLLMMPTRSDKLARMMRGRD